jgi:chromosome segregation ATPase
VAGAWTGVDKGGLSSVVLVLHAPGSIHRLEPLRGPSNATRHWSAVFAWSGNPESVERAALVLGDSLVVELPFDNSKQLRRGFKRTRLPVRELQQETTAGAVPAADSDVLALHAAMVTAQDEAAKAISDAERATHDRVRQEKEIARLRESMSSLRRLTETALEKEREAARAVSSQLEEARVEIERLETRLDELAGESQEHSERTQTALRDTRARLAAAEADLTRRENSAAALERAEAEVERLQSKLVAVRTAVEQTLNGRDGLAG